MRCQSTFDTIRAPENTPNRNTYTLCSSRIQTWDMQGINLPAARGVSTYAEYESHRCPLFCFRHIPAMHTSTANDAHVQSLPSPHSCCIRVVCSCCIRVVCSCCVRVAPATTSAQTARSVRQLSEIYIGGVPARQVSTSQQKTTRAGLRSGNVITLATSTIRPAAGGPSLSRTLSKSVDMA
jgi:hypothetical protein